MQIELTKEEKEKEDVESWEECLSEQKFWILYERKNNYKLGFGDFLTEVSKLKNQYDIEQKILGYFRIPDANETEIYQIAKDDGLSKAVFDRIKDIADLPEQILDKLHKLDSEA